MVLRETHISWVALVGDRAYKVKKPVVLPFLDYGTPARRRAACEDEVRLNRRLAPGIYLGTRSLVPCLGGLTLADAGEPEAVEHVVEMRRFDDRDTLEAQVLAGAVTPAQAQWVGAVIARFHCDAPRFPDADTGAARAAVASTLETLHRLGHPMRGVGDALDARLHQRQDDLTARVRDGFVRDGHGDLRAEHVILRDDGIAIVDCVEFSRALRQLDTGADLSFLVMDLVRLGRPDLARDLVAGYRDAGGEPGDDTLVALHGACRALVRAEVELLRSQQLGGDAAAERRAVRLMDVAERLTWRSYAPLLIAIAGVAASGKSTLARALAAASGFPALDSDVVRKRLAAVDDEAPGGSGLYDEAHDRATYRELLRLAVAAASSSDGVIVEATFRRPADREALAAAASAAGLRLIVVECRAPAAVLRERAERRELAAAGPSDATADVAMHQLRDWVPLPPELAAVQVNALRPVPEQRVQVLAALGSMRTFTDTAAGTEPMRSRPAAASMGS